MSEPFLGMIKPFGFNFAPRGWAQCDGQILPINQNQALYSLLGTTYGGDGRTTFALPDLRGRVPMHFTSGYNLGQRSGAETVPLSVAQMPPHSHALVAVSDNANNEEPEDNLLARAEQAVYVGAGTPTALHADSILDAGGGQGHANVQPSLVLNFCIALQGLFPSRN